MAKATKTVHTKEIKPEQTITVNVTLDPPPEAKKSKYLKLTRDEWIKSIPIFLTFLSVCIASMVIYNTNKTIKMTLHQNQKANEQFVKLNRPFLDLIEVGMDSHIVGRNPTIRCSLTNKGKFAAFSEEVRTFEGYVPRSCDKDSMMHKFEKKLQNNSRYDLGLIPSYLGMLNLTMPSPTPLTQDEYNSIYNGTYTYYLYVIVKYQDLITKVTYHLKEGVLLQLVPTREMKTFTYSADAIDSTQ